MRLWHDPGPALVEDDPSHKRRGSLGGEDYRMGVGTPLFAPCDGVIRARNGGTGGYTLSLNPDGYPAAVAIEAMHCSRFNGLSMGGPSRRVREGELVGWSGGAQGAPGAGSSTGPHCHEHVDLVGGGRTGLGLFIRANGGSTPASGGNATPATRSQEDIMDELSPATKKFITDTVRDQQNSLLNEDKPDRPGLKNEIVRQVNQSLRTIKAEITQEIINAITRERWQLAKIKGRDTIWAINMVTGRFEEFTSMAQLAQAQRFEKISTYVVNGVRVPEPAMEFDDRPQLQAFIDGLEPKPDALVS